MKKKIGKVRTGIFVCTCLLLAGMCLTFSGCESTELEERKFPLVIAVDKKSLGAEEEGGNLSSFQISMGFQNLAEVADEKAKDAGSAPTKTEEMSWYEAFEESDASSPKMMDYNHLKAIILSRELLEDKEMLEELLDFVKEQEVFARNTLLFTSESEAANILELEGELDLPVGTWLEEMAAGNTELKDPAIVTLGSLLNEYENRMENLYIPVLEAAEDTIRIDQYYVISAYENCGIVSKDAYRHAMLAEGKMEQYDTDLDGGEAIRLKEIRTQKSYQRLDDEIQLQIDLRAEAKLLNGTIANAKEQEELKKKIEEQLTRELQNEADLLLFEMQVDMANSFYSLGGYERELYQKYKEDIGNYRNHLRLKILTEITPVTE